MTFSANNLIWVDLEMTGLNPEKERIIEMAIIITDSQLNILAEAPVLAIHQSDGLLNSMDAWNTKQHNSSGLVERVRKSTITEAQAEAAMLEFLRQYVPAGKSPMCGNTIYQDRRFLVKYMPELERYFHYRLLDVSTLKELALRWAPRVYNGLQKESTHLALDDVRDSIAELKYYRDMLFNPEVITS
jgi:oligoribonuclease